MVFSQLSFLYFFFPLVIVLYFLIRSRPWRNAVLLVCSLLFYSWGEPRYVLVMVAASLAAWLAGLLIEHFRARPGRKKLVLAACVVLLLGNLMVFKYLGFLVENVNGLLGLHINIGAITLPIGISFYTFQILSYVIDLYRDKVGVQRNFFYFTLYVSFFPQLIAGPIVRYQTVEEEIRNRHENWDDAVYGTRRFIVGLAKKVLLANNMAKLAELVYTSGAQGLGTSAYWLAAVGYTLQIYFDFSGYSDMAIGLGRIFGFRFNENFDHPYCADSVGTFWRRWHMSLTSWFRDYLYIPLGGNRGGTARTIRNLLIVWFCTGFWHGASWNFILWGLYFAAWLILERYVLRGVLEKTPAILKHLYTLIVVFVGWGLFAMVDLGVCGDYLAACFGGAPLWSGADLFRLRSYAVTLAVLVLASTALGQRLWAKLPRQAEQLATPVLMGLSLVVCTAYLVDGSYNPFLYFRF